MKIFKYIPFIVIFFIILLVFRTWFISSEIIGGDWPFYHPTIIKSFNFLPPIWSQAHGNGLGGTILSYGIDTYLYLTGTIFSNILGIPWNITYKIVWFGLFILICFSGSFKLYKKTTNSKDIIFASVAGLIYTTNSYILMAVGGGQMGIALAYSIFPYVVFFLISTLDSLGDKWFKLIKNSICLSLFFALQALFDPRIAYISAGLILFFIISELIKREKSEIRLFNLFKIIIVFLIVGIVTLLLSAFWIFPLAFVQNISSGSLGLSSSVHEVLKFYSFAKFENTLSLLHPNWPENIFGKVAFMKPEFLLLAILAFLPLVLRKEKNRTVLLLSLISLVGIFLAKGNNPPFGTVYEFLFSHLPGFIVFRDPTKFYFLIAMSFAILIPHGLEILTTQITRNNKSQSNIRKFIPLIFFLLLWSILCIPALTSSLSGTFNQNQPADEYKALSSSIGKEQQFFRTLWVPRQSRLADPSAIHPTVEAQPLLKATDAAQLKSIFAKKIIQEYLSDRAIKYIILPYDTYGEIFLDDRKYSEKEREKYKKVLDNTYWLKKIQDDNLTIYKLSQNPKGLFFSKSEEQIAYTKISDVEYEIILNRSVDQDLFFSQNYHPLWVVHYSGETIHPMRTNDGLIKFHLPSGVKKITLLFEGRNIYKKSLNITITTILSLTLVLLVVKLISIKSDLKNYEKK